MKTSSALATDYSNGVAPRRGVDPRELIYQLRVRLDGTNAERALLLISDGPKRDDLLKRYLRNSMWKKVAARYWSRMPSKLDPHLATIEGWLAVEPDITALVIVDRLAGIHTATFGDSSNQSCSGSCDCYYVRRQRNCSQRPGLCAALRVECSPPRPQPLHRNKLRRELHATQIV